MPSIAQIPVSSSITNSPPSGKKRKREQCSHGDGDDHTRLSSLQHTLPFPHSRFLSNTSLHDNAPTATAPHLSYVSRLTLKPRSLKPLRPHDAKRQRIPLSELGKQQQQQQQQQEEEEEDLSTALEHESSATSNDSANAFPTNIRSSTAKEEECRRPNLRSCHICHQKPKVRTDLDSYGDCQCCGERTCYICMRECPGLVTPAAWERTKTEIRMSFTTDNDELSLGDGAEHRRFDLRPAHGRDEEEEYGDGWLENVEKEWGHRGMICSRCCVERGVDGEVRCLGCLRTEEGRRGRYITST